MVTIKECGEPLVDVKKICPDLVVYLTRHREGKRRVAYLRETVAKMVCQAKKELPIGMTFIINDAWRPQYVQKKIFKRFMNFFSKQYPNWPKDKVIKVVKRYVAPSRGKFVSGHITGAAVDLRLWKNGRKVPMGSPKLTYLTYQENSKSFQPKLPKYIQKNREIMFNALRKAGLSNLSKEFWHWSYGDVWWAKRNKKKTAIYGAIKNLNLYR